MKTLIVAFALSLAIHFIMYFTIEKTLQNNTLNINTTNKQNTTKKNGFVKVKYVKVKKTKPKPKPTQKKQIKKETTKQVVKNKKVEQVVKKTIPRINLPVIKKEPLDLKKFFTIQKQEKLEQENEQKKATQRQNEIEEIEKLSALTQSYIKLYGEKYFEFSENQRKYLRENLNKIGKITQNYLEYPSVSIRTKQQGVNIVEFYLHPNGDITDLKLIDSSYYSALDSNSVDTIKVAYQDYPKPLEKVKIKIYIKYRLY